MFLIRSVVVFSYEEKYTNFFNQCICLQFGQIPLLTFPDNIKLIVAFLECRVYCYISCESTIKRNRNILKTSPGHNASELAHHTKNRFESRFN